MVLTELLTYARGILTHVPWTHWAVMGVASLVLTAIRLLRKKCSVYGAIALGLTVFMGLFLLDTAVGIRYLGIMKHAAGHNLTLVFSRMFQKSGQGPVETLSNFAVFVPFGFFLGEWLASSNRTGAWHRVGLVTLAGFGLSMCIECLQLVLKVGYFEVMDLVLNTVGAFVGAGVAVWIRDIIWRIKNSYNKRMGKDELFPDCGVRENERLYVIGNGFDIHHCIESKYWDFKNWLVKNNKTNLIGLMDTFFSNECEFWGDIENALGDYREDGITDYCEPDNPEDFKYDHPGQWQDGVEGGISWIFRGTMNQFRDAFDDWVNSISLSDVEADLYLPTTSKYLTFNYTETLEKFYHIPDDNVLHIHGSRLKPGDEFIIGHGNRRDSNEPYSDEEQLLPYQNANSEVIEIMNQWTKDPKSIINRNKPFFKSLQKCKAVSVMGLSYNDIDMPYLEEVATSVSADCKWWLYYHSDKDKEKAEVAAVKLGLKDFCFKRFE